MVAEYPAPKLNREINWCLNVCEYGLGWVEQWIYYDMDHRFAQPNLQYLI